MSLSFLLKMSCPTVNSCDSKTTSIDQINDLRSAHNLEHNRREVAKFWEIRGHCSTVLIPAPYPDICLPTSSAQYQYKLHSTDLVPGQELVSVLRQAHYQVLARLNISGNQSKRFVLPSQLIRLKYIDPYSRQRIVEKICKFLSCQGHLRSVVLEQAELSLADLCRLLVAVAGNSLVKRLYLWGALDPCQVPFRGPLESDHVVDEIPRIPFTYNPGGRKYIRELERRKKEDQQIPASQFKLKSGQVLNLKTTTNLEARSLVSWVENYIETELLAPGHRGTTGKKIRKETSNLVDNVDKRDYVYTQFNVGVQCDKSQESNYTSTCRSPKRPSTVGYINKEEEEYLELLRVRAKLECCQDYLKLYEHSALNIHVLRKVLRVALNGFVNLTTLSVNYSLLADGTGETLLSIGSLLRGRLLDLELLCNVEDVPWSDHQQFESRAVHSIPDLTWHRVREICPRLQVHLVCAWLSSYDRTRGFITRSIPLSSLHMFGGFCPTINTHELMFFSTLKFIGHYYKHTLEVVDILIWHSSGRIDSSLEKLLTEAYKLRSFSYCGPLQYMASVSRLCDAALRPESGLVRFSLMLQGDPCFSHAAHELTQRLYIEYQPKFADRSIDFVLATHNSSKHATF